MSIFNLPVEIIPKPESMHPWARTIKAENFVKAKRAHNSINNVIYPKPKENDKRRVKQVPLDKRVTFTVVGNRVTKEFIYCVHLVQHMHKYRPYKYNAPVIKGCTGVEWSDHLDKLKAKYGCAMRHCLQNQVAVIHNDQFIGGENELKCLIEREYYVNMVALNYQKESIKQFSNFIKSTGSPCAYLHISIDGNPIGTLIFRLYASIVPRTCENFLRLCQLNKGGYSGTPVHRVVKDGWIQCGGFGLKSKPMDCENFIVPFDRRGVIGMANDGRNVDCSTQFFILLQPLPDLKSKYVAFGQLIDGEETLKKIEQVETFYEAPLSSISIYDAGIINLDCMRHIPINKNCQDYIEGHIDDLVIIGDIFYEMLLELVFLEVEFRNIQKLEEVDGENYGGAFKETVDKQGNYLPDNIHATKRFMRKKDEQAKQIRGRTSSVASRHSRHDNDTENNVFDVETAFSYEPEEYVYPITLPSEQLHKPTKPYYLAPTDVPYPGEKDSNFDLKRFLQGDYCFEPDLDKKQPKVTEDHKKWVVDERVKAVSEIIISYGGVTWLTGSSSSSAESMELDSDEEKEIKEYLNQNTEKACFSGRVVKEIAKTYVNVNPINEIPPTVKFIDEEIRRLRMAVQDLKERDSKKVLICTQPWEVKKEIRRKKTGWGEVLTKELKYLSPSSSERLSTVPRRTSVQIRGADPKATERKRRPTGFLSPEDLAKLNIKQRELQESDDDDKKEMEKKKEEEIRTNMARMQTGKNVKLRLQTSDDADKQKGTMKPQTDPRRVSIAAPGLNSEETYYDRDTRLSMRESRKESKARPSVMMRLYEDLAMDEQETPTLKDYRPSQIKEKKDKLPFEDEYESPFFRRHEKSLLPIKKISMETSQDDKKKKRISSTESLIGASHFDKPFLNSLRAVEYARKRPSISIARYQMKNKFAEEKRREEAASNKYRGILMPGDSPLFLNTPRDSEAYYYHGSRLIIKKQETK